MALTSRDIDNQSFSVERKGYSIEEVDNFLERVSKEVGAMNAKLQQLEQQNADAAGGVTESQATELNSIIQSQKQEIANLKADLDEKVQDGNAISEALIVAQRSADKLIQEANEKSKKIIQEANDKADYIEKDADTQKKKVLAEIDKLEKEQTAARKKYQVMLRDIINAMEENLSEFEGKPISQIKDEIESFDDENIAQETNGETMANPVVAPAAVNAVNPEPEKDFSGFGDTDFGGDKIDQFQLSNNDKNIINVYVTPKSGRDCLCGIEADMKGEPLLKVKVTAAPDGGKANVAVCKLIAGDISVPKSFVTVKRGTKSRYKQIQIVCDSEKFNN